MGAVLARALQVLGRRWRAAYLASAAVTLVNTVPDVVRQLLVWDDPSALHAALVDVVGFLTALAAQLWLTGALADLPGGGRVRTRGALRRGSALAWTAVRSAPAAAVAGVAVGGGVSALVTLPASVAAIGWHRVLGPLDDPSAGGFVIATASDALASWLTLPFLALVWAVAARSGARPEQPGVPGGGTPGTMRP